ncbi:hypothetical protein [Leucobacter sp. VD1]|uniref:hypothetical protein n=1 Tax=Leucobacter sp. VD1 TaxID=3080381 RepID=UPI003019AB92
MQTETLRLLSVLPLAELVELAGDPVLAREDATGAEMSLRLPVMSDPADDDPAALGRAG